MWNFKELALSNSSNVDTVGNVTNADKIIVAYFHPFVKFKASVSPNLAFLVPQVTRKGADAVDVRCESCFDFNPPYRSFFLKRQFKALWVQTTIFIYLLINGRNGHEGQ